MAAENANSPIRLREECDDKQASDAEGVKADPEVKLPPDREPTCQELKARMDWVMRDIKKRRAEQLNGRPPGALYPDGTMSKKGGDISGKDVWAGHDEQITGKRNHLESLRNRYRQPTRDRGGCDDPPDDPGLKRVDNVITTPNPTAEDWEKHNEITVGEWIKKNPNTVRATAAIGAAYVIYRVIRFIPSLLPPLWPTIPENLAIP